MNKIINILVPDIGDFADVPVVELSVAVGDTIAKDDTVLLLESDKATLEIPSSFGGTISEITVAEGDIVSMGTVIARISIDAALPDTSVTTPTPPKAEPEPISPPPDPILTALPAVVQPSDGISAHASPSVRKFAREFGIDLTRVPATGRKGRITREDITTFVKAAIENPSTGAGFGMPVMGLPAWPKVDFEKFGPIHREKLSRIAKISGPSLARNAMFIPHVTNFDEADITDLETFRKTINAETKDGVKMSILAFVVKAVVAALKQNPKFNASLDGDEIIVKEYYHIGVAADTPDGLVVPVIKNADQKGVAEIAAEMADLAGAARAGKLKPADMQGGTFTISSLGGIGGTNFSPIINAPEVAILGMTRAAIKPVWDGAGFVPRLIQPLSMSWDHRVVDGVAAAKFLKIVQSVLSDFRRYSL